MGTEPMWKILLGLIDRLFPVIAKNPFAFSSIYAAVCFLLGAASLSAFARMFGFDRLLPYLGSAYVVTFLVTVFALVIVPWAFPSCQGWHTGRTGRRIVFGALLLLLLTDIAFWGAFAFGYL